MLTQAEVAEMVAADRRQRAHQDHLRLHGLDELSHALLVALDELRLFDPSKHARNPKGSPGGGRFKSMVDRLKDAIVEHHKSGGTGNPFKDFSREQLRRVAKARGIVLARGESHDSITKKLLDHLHDGKNSEPQKVTALAKKAAPRKVVAEKAALKPNRQGGLSGPGALKAAPVELGTGKAARVARGDVTHEQEEALISYRMGGYQPINGKLRDSKYKLLGVTPSQVRQYVTHLDAVMKKSKLTSAVEVHRGVRDVGSMFPGIDTSKPLVGMEYRDKSFVSTTTDERIARTFVGNDHVLLRVMVPAGTGAVQLSGYSPDQPADRPNVKHEAELLLQRGLKYRVTDDRIEDGLRVLGIEVIP